MDSNPTIPFVNKEQTRHMAQHPQNDTANRQSPTGFVADSLSPRRRVGYGLPCANCKAYYSSDSIACPYCGSSERVSATGVSVTQPADVLKEELRSLQAEIADALCKDLGEGPAAPARQGEDRERFLREYKTQLYASHTQINPGTAFRCSIEKNHQNGNEPAAICKTCYNQAAERLEQIEAGLRIDVREAAQLIYEAVWADPSPADPSRTYQNAAEAVLGEIRRRAGLSLPLGSLTPYTH